jgi:hypothetical protein
MPFTYLHIPADPNNSPERFLRFNARLRDSDWLRVLLAACRAGDGRKPGISAATSNECD